MESFENDDEKNEYEYEYDNEYINEKEKDEELIEKKFENAIKSENCENELLSLIDLSFISNFCEIWKFRIYEELCLYTFKNKNFSQFEKYFDIIIELYGNIDYYKKDELFTKILNIFFSFEGKYSTLTYIINIIFKILQKYKETDKIIEIVNIITKKYLIIILDRVLYFVIQPPKSKLFLMKLFYKKFKIISKEKYAEMIFSFPVSGNLISFIDCSIIIYDQNNHILQEIKNAHKKKINYLCIIDENNFITCSDDKSIKTWNKLNKFFIIHKIIINAHDKVINKVLYTKNKMIISCSDNMIIKIWELVNNKYQNVTILMNQNNDILFEQKFSSIIYLEDKNMLISCCRGISFWNCNNFELIYYDNINFSNSTDLCRINEDEIIVYEGYENNNLMKIFSISKKKLIKIIRNSFKLFSILPLKNDFFLVGGNNLSLYNNKNLIPIEYIFNKKLDYRDFNGKLCLNIINGEYETIKKICLFKDNQILITYNSKNLLIEIDL